MIILLSPSKGQDFDPNPISEHSQPQLLSQAAELARGLKKLKPAQIASLMSVSESLAELNYQRFQDFSTPFELGRAKQAALAFKGDVYGGLDADTLDDADWHFAQQHLRILSGLYGYLRPLDLILPYRLEMKTRLNNSRGENLYQYWDHQITDLINQDLQGDDDYVVNLASNEYFKSVKKKAINQRIITLHFKDTKAGKTRVIGFFAKQARGMMARALIKEKVNAADDIKELVVNGYRYDESLSKTNDWVFERQQPPAKT
ncbi:peroxide stress protein YaaA [Marinicella sediminis]|uniref:UPF0246 protein ACFODZ_15055 n=1 Tax=Marinicella sediminis TaxID=1792834 RepID=A0ABV7JEF8_9GAMM|nr:peroxide stress protein YaaA [Marinicella sediminis]